MSAIVSDLVVQTEAAAAEAVAEHYLRFLTEVERSGGIEAVARALDHGYDADLDERTSSAQPVGFDHIAISRVFRRRLRPLFGGRPVSNHIWGADEDQGLFSLFGRAQVVGPPTLPPRRTRASSLVQRLIRDCRNYRQAEKATRAVEPTRMVTIPSPLFVATQLLGDPRNAGSQIYAEAALREWAREQIELSIGGPLDLSFAAISEALTLISNRWRTSKPIIADLQQNGPTVVFVCNLLAIRGMAAMRVDIGFLASILQRGAAQRDEVTEDALFAERGEIQEMDNELRSLWLGEQHWPCEFIINPQYVELPSAGELLNLVDSLPIPFEGAETIFQGGIRLSAERSLVAAISGEFGTGKTLFGLSLAAGLAPLGCRTLFLSCEESAKDIQARLLEAAPRSLFRTLPLFKALDEGDFQLRRFERQLASEDVEVALPWFQARQLEVRMDSESARVDPGAALAELLKEAIEKAELFRPWRSPIEERRPNFARPVIIIDGLHQLFDLPDTYDLWDSSLQRLVDTCRGLGAVFFFSFSSESASLRRMEYLCDLIIEVERGGHSDPAATPSRVFQLLKARRQPARTGAHVFHIRGEAGFRLKPSVDARLQELKGQRWWAPGDRGDIFLTDEPPSDFKRGRDSKTSGGNLPIANHSQVLVIGQGSSGKASFALYLLHRRWFDMSMIHDDRQMTLPMDRARRGAALPARKQAIMAADLPLRGDAPYLETRVLVISFLYQQSYYDELTAKLRGSLRAGRTERGITSYARLEDLGPFEFAASPDRLRTDTIELYPGMLSVEDFIAKVDKRLTAAEQSGVPYTGVLVDGLHNVFVQFPALENESSFWGMFYSILRRRRVTVVTTHTEFDVTAHPDQQDAEVTRRHANAYNFEQAQRKIAPLLSALVSGADYLFDLSPAYERGGLIYRLTPRAALEGLTGSHSYAWDKKQMRVESLSLFNPDSPASRRPDIAKRLGEQLMILLEASFVK